jgi:hypothetical protein
MMRRPIDVFAVLGSILLAATVGTSATQAADTQAAWTGLAEVTLSTSACAGVGGTSVGNAHPSTYRPKIASTDTVTYVSFLGLEAALTLENTSESTVHQMHGSGNYSASAIDRRAKPFSYTGTYNFTVTPAAVVASTTEVTIIGTIFTYFNNVGCNVSFTAAYTPVK